MSEHRDQDELIESYLLEELSAAERQQFEKRMADDELLKRKVEEQGAFFELIKSSRHAAMKEKLKNIHDKLKTEESAQPIAPKTTGRLIPFNASYLLKIAAAIAVIIILGLSYYLIADRARENNDMMVNTESETSSAEEDEPAFGATRYLLLDSMLDLKKLEIKADKSAQIVDSSTIQLQILLHEKEASLYSFDGHNLRIFTDQKATYTNAQLQLFELTEQNGTVTIYGKWNFDTEFFEIDTTGVLQPWQQVEDLQKKKMLSSLLDK